MKKRLAIHTLLKAFGITDKKIIHCLQKKEVIKNFNSINKIKVSRALTKIYELILEKDINIVRFLPRNFKKLY